MKLTDDEKDALVAVQDELPLTFKLLDRAVATMETALLQSDVSDKDAIFVLRIKLEGARSLRNLYKSSVLELSKKAK